jgi:hypothetical protein
MWHFLFGAVNIIAMLCWAVLLLAPRSDLSRSFIMYCGVALLCLVYTVLLVLLVTGLVDGDKVADAGSAGFTSIEGVRGIFLSDGGVTVGWTHYLALDLFTGLWIARDADAKKFPRLMQAPVLLLTFIAGPVGLLLWLCIREPAARRAAGPRQRIKR